MTKKHLNGFSIVFAVIALLSIFLPFVKVGEEYVFGSLLFASYSIEEVLGLPDAVVAGPNIFYIVGVAATLITLFLLFTNVKFKTVACLVSSSIATLGFALVGFTFNLIYSFQGSFEYDGFAFGFDVGWYITTISMLAIVIINVILLTCGKNMLERTLISEVQRRNNKGWWFVSPFLIGFLCFYLQPLAVSIWYVFNIFRLDVASGGGYILEFCGLDNIAEMFTTETKFWMSLTNTLSSMLTTVPIVIIFSIFLAVILNQKFKGRTLVRAIFFMPVVVTGGIVMGIISGDTVTKMLTDGVENTSTTTLFEAAGLMEVLEGMNLPEGIVEVFSTIVGSIFDTLWKCGVQILLFLSALQSIPNQLYEAAKIEGATGWESFWKVTFPNLVPIILVNIIYTIIDTLTSSNEVMSTIELVAFKNFAYHKGCLEAWIFFIVLIAIVGAIFGIFALIQREPKLDKVAKRGR